MQPVRSLKSTGAKAGVAFDRKGRLSEIKDDGSGKLIASAFSVRSKIRSAGLHAHSCTGGR